MFVPYHWPGARSVKRLTHRTLDPRSKIPEYKVSACRLQGRRTPGVGEGRASTRSFPAHAEAPSCAGGLVVYGYEFFVDPSRCIGCESCVNACAECETHRGQSMIHLDFIDRRQTTATVPSVCMHCDDPTCAQVCPADAIKKTEDGFVAVVPEAALHRLLQLRPGLPLRDPEGHGRGRADDEV